MKYFLIEAHRPGITWEKQTRIISARTLAEACTQVENYGLEISVAKDLEEGILSGPVTAEELRKSNPHLFTPFETSVPGKEFKFDVRRPNSPKEETIAIYATSVAEAFNKVIAAGWEVERAWDTSGWEAAE